MHLNVSTETQSCYTHNFRLQFGFRIMTQSIDSKPHTTRSNWQICFKDRFGWGLAMLKIILNPSPSHNHYLSSLRFITHYDPSLLSRFTTAKHNMQFHHHFYIINCSQQRPITIICALPSSTPFVHNNK